MADNIDIIVAGGVTKTIATDDVGGIHFQRQKLTWGPDGTANDADVASGKPLPVQLRGSAGADVVKLIDGPLGAADPGIMALAVRDDVLSTRAEADGDVTALRTDSTGAVWMTPADMVQVIGSTDHGTADTLYPIKIGGKATASLAADVTDGHRVNASFMLDGRLRVAGGLSGGGLGVSERASTGVCTTTIVTVNSATATGTQLIAANALGTRRRVVVSQRSATVQVEVAPGNITAATGKGRPLPAVIGAELPYFMAGELRATCASGTTEVAVTEELNAA